MNDLTTRAAVEALQAEMLKLPQLELQTDHHFADGMYCRVVHRPAGALIVGKVHKREHFYIVAKGRVQVGREVFGAGTVIVSQPGTKRAVLALEDSICLTVHRTAKKNLDKIERELVEPDKTALFDSRNKLKELPCPGYP
jgi:hypothetical protein